MVKFEIWSIILDKSGKSKSKLKECYSPGKKTFKYQYWDASRQLRNTAIGDIKSEIFYVQQSIFLFF